ncbi:L-dopachrome tautomerase-related protein [Aureimonas phyllosphaerae]|uniref:Sugar lactone lactonase YvrE n=1 Tax=Aureimonas phyllosphaerae TaxID=1166078 RepID=A0A7W6BY15_9HYPH|nr:L-dopachrome tautomerase-related protein [Aureimonas phyllosphaerae]MBB3938169.1 sugar lactone lactonase YvrE [Aureimonas phyllosphaerae]MBB3962177.1 sugar lactone lactonase YvrE [Aureimonas phyllosphaerae]SFF56517.1 Sugar lactone lactonase YvrE [Aureimonas phyllosphaerae]
MPASLSRLAASALSASVLLLVPAISLAQDAKARIEKVADFPHQVTGVTVAQDGRIFVNFPRWTEDSPVSVAEVGKDGSIRPYPNDEWNAWRNARKDDLSAGDHFVCVQSVVADGRGAIWALDAGAPAQSLLVPGAPKLVRLDLASDTATRTIAFDESVAPQGSYLNDVRFSSDGRHAFITDSGAKGALVVVDLESGKAVRVLDGDPSTQVKKGLVVEADGRPLRRPDGRGVEFSADGIALSKDGRHLYWQAIKGDTLYRIETAALVAALDGTVDLSEKVEAFGRNGVADGLLIGRDSGDMYVTAPQDDAVKIRDLSAGASGEPRILVEDERLRWPDTLSEGPDGTVYVTTSRIQDSAFFKPDAPAALPTQLWRIVR